MSVMHPRDQVASLMDRVSALEAERAAFADAMPQFEPQVFSLRDYFAGQALVGLMTDISLTNMGRTEAVYLENVGHLMRSLSTTAYLAADAMLAARAVKPEGHP